jgi:hypothetical protein
MTTAQTKKSGGGRRSRGHWAYGDESFATEREMILRVLDDFRCTEAFGAEYVPLWLRTSDQDIVKGGLRVVGEREAYHARLMESRLRELGGVPRCEIPADVRKRKLAFYGSTTLKDAGKLRDEAAEIGDPATALRRYTDVVDRIRDDIITKQLLYWILQDELSTIRWVKETAAMLNPVR